jgi:hypothetical protein
VLGVGEAKPEATACRVEKGTTNYLSIKGKIRTFMLSPSLILFQQGLK